MQTEKKAAEEALWQENETVVGLQKELKEQRAGEQQDGMVLVKEQEYTDLLVVRHSVCLVNASDYPTHRDLGM